MSASALQGQTGVYPRPYPMTLSKYRNTSGSVTPTPVIISPAGTSFHSPEFQALGMSLAMSSDEITSMWRAPPSPRHSIQASSGKAASGKTKKRQEQNRNAQRLYRQRKAQYVQGLLSHIDQINRTHTSLQNSCKALCQEIAGLQGQVEALKEQLEFWSRVEIVLLKTPQDDQAIASKRTGMGSGATGFAENYPPYPNFDYYIGS